MQVSSFAHKLAHTEKRVRDKAFNKLVQYIANQSCEIPQVTWLKLSKAIFYCYWMSDKRPVQLFLSTRIASLIESLEKRQAFTFRACFIHIISREWAGIDSHRLDKFYLLLRQIISHSFLQCQRLEWSSESCLSFLESLKFDQVCNGILYHFISCFFEECSAELPNEVAVFFCREFATLVAKTDNETVRTMICDEIYSKVDDLNCFKRLDKKDLVAAIWQVASNADCSHAGRKILYETAEKLAAGMDLDIADLVKQNLTEKQSLAAIDKDLEPKIADAVMIDSEVTDVETAPEPKTLKLKKKKKKSAAKAEVKVKVELPEEKSVNESSETSGLDKSLTEMKVKSKKIKTKKVTESAVNDSQVTESNIQQLDIDQKKSVKFNLEANKTKCMIITNI